MLRPSVLNKIVSVQPIKTSLIVTAVKYGLADAYLQLRIEQKKEVDKQRIATFALFGFACQGGFQ